MLQEVVADMNSDTDRSKSSLGKAHAVACVRVWWTLSLLLRTYSAVTDLNCSNSERVSSEIWGQGSREE